MHKSKLATLIALLVGAYIFGFTLTMGWIGSIVLFVIFAGYGFIPQGGTWSSLWKQVIYFFHSNEDDLKEEKEAKELINEEEHFGNVAVGLSGGVDSAVTAYLLKKQGYNVTAFFMRNWDSEYASEYKELKRLLDTETGKCQASLDLKDAKEVAKQLDIPLVEVNFVKEYWDQVFSTFLEGIKKGITPNPDILCNSKIKFGAFVKYIRKNHPEMQYIATGHYASIRNKGSKYYMAEAHDDWKDQTYFLAEIDKELLKMIKFPLGNIPKKEVREIAKREQLVVANKKDSVGICFVGKRNFQEFISNYVEEKPGDIIDIDTKEVVSDHKGAIFYTIGQRRGLDIGGSEKPYFVVDKDIDKNIVYVAMGEDHPLLNKDEVSARDIHLLVDPSEFKTNHIYVKLRHSNIKHKAKVVNIEEQENGLLKIDFKLTEKVFAITSGQELVMYRKGICLGGGKII